MIAFINRRVLLAADFMTNIVMLTALWSYERIARYRASRNFSVELTSIRSYPLRHGRRGRGVL